MKLGRPRRGGKRTLNSALTRIAALGTCVILAAGSASASPRPKLLVAGDHANAPYEYLEDGQATGFNVELMRAAAAAAGFDVEIRLGPWAQARSDLEDGKVDALSGMYWSEERSERVEFSVPHTMVRSALFVREDSPIRTFADLHGKEVILQEGDVVHDLFKRTGLASRIVAVTDPDDQLRVLAAGRGDGALMVSRLQGEYYARRLGLQGLRIVEADLPQLRYCFAVRKGNRELLYRLDEGLNLLGVSGKYREIYERWFGVYEKPDIWRYVGILAIALAVLTVLLAASVLWSRWLERTVRLRTAALQASEEELRRANGELRQAHDELREAHDELEKRVVERTAELQRSNERLGVSEAEKALILNSTSDIVVFLDPERRIHWGNEQAARLAGTTPDGLKGRHCWETLRARNEPCPGCPVMLSMANGEPRSAEISEQGGVFLHRAYPARDEQGRLLGTVALLLDITERKRTEEALRESEEWLKLTVEATGAGILTGVPPGQAQVSDDARRILGLPDDFVLDFQEFLGLVHGGDRAAVKAALERTLDPAGDGRAEGEFRIVQPDGSTRWIAARIKARFAEVDGVLRAVRMASIVLDVTDRKREEEALRESEERFHTLADNIAQLAWMADGRGQIFWFSRRCLEYTGAGAGPLQLGPFLHPDHLGRVAEKMSRAFSTGEVFEDTFQLRGKDGRYRWFLSRAVPVHDRAGEVVRWLGTATDVSDQCEVEEALRESEARGRAILASLAEGVIEQDAEGRITAANEAAEKLIGIARAELVGHTFFEIRQGSVLRPDGTPLPPEEQPVLLALRTGRGQSDVELGWRRPDGAVTWFAIHVQPVRLPDGRVAGVVSSFFDITQRHQALQRSEGHLRTMADNVPDAIVRYDRELRIRFANEAAAAAIGAPLDQLIGRTRTELGMSPERAALWDEYARKVFRTSSGLRFEFGFDAPDGPCYESRLIPERDRDGAVESVLAITRDISDRKQAERQLLTSREQLRELVARLNSVREEEKVRLSRELHDEMGQLLTALRLELEVLEDRLGDPAMPEIVREVLERAVAASELVEKTIRSMRNILSALRPVALDRLGLGAALRQECHRFQEWSGVACDFAPAYGLSSFGAEVDTALFRIAQEALTNVARHAGASRVAVSLGWRTGAALLQVEDDGRGIPPGHESAGLGLLGMRERAERLGGILALKPAPRGGTRVEACIPVGSPTSRKDVS